MARKHGGSEGSEGGNHPPRVARGLGERIKAAADAIGSRKQAARLAGVSDDMLYRYMREETPPRFEAVVSLAQAAGLSLEWMATGRQAPGAAREAPAEYASDPEQRASERLREIQQMLEAETALPIPPERFASDDALRLALADLRRIASSPTLPEALRSQAAEASANEFGAPPGLPSQATAQVAPRSAQRLAEVADELEAAIREAEYRPPELILDGFKTAMYVDGMPRAAAVTLLKFLDAYERKQRR